MSITPISQNEINQNKVASLPARPNSSTAFGGAGYSSMQLREAFDKLPLLAVRKLNELLEALSKAPGEGSLADEIKTAKCDPQGTPYTLSQLFTHIIDGTLASYLLVGGKPLDIAMAENASRGFLESPAFEGEPTAPTPSAENDSDRIATTAFVQALLRIAAQAGVEEVKALTGEALRFFVGTQAQYEALTDKTNLLAIITDDATKETLHTLAQAVAALEERVNNSQDNSSGENASDFEEQIGILTSNLENLENALLTGTISVKSADQATVAITAQTAQEAMHADTSSQAGYAAEATYANVAGGLSLKQDMPPFFSGQCAFPAEKGIYVFSVESRTLILYIPEPVGPGSLQYSTECIADDGVARRLKYYNGILYVQKKNDGGDYENDIEYNEDFKNMKLASVYQ